MSDLTTPFRSTCPVCFNIDGSLIVASSLYHDEREPITEYICAFGHRWRSDLRTESVTILDQPEREEPSMTITESTDPDLANFTEAQRIELEQLGVADWTSVAALKSQILSMNWANRQLTSERDTLGVTIGQLRENISAIGDRLLSEAQDRGWCSDFDHIVKDLNESMHDIEGGLLKTRRFSRRVTVQFEIDVEGSGTLYAVNEALVAWCMHDLDNQGELVDRGENQSVRIDNSVVRNAYVVSNDDRSQ